MSACLFDCLFHTFIHFVCIRYEETILFPRLQEHWNSAEFQTNISDQHLLLDSQIETLQNLVQTVKEGSSVLPQEEMLFLLLTAIELDEILLHHLGLLFSFFLLTFFLFFVISFILLAYEEDHLIPVLLSLSSEEFESISSNGDSKIT